ncbi:MAG: hypothetical protein PHT55_02805 [Spirochaetales bacterium]|nr:hypothetical protein [Spirochaetales bacterium]
MALLPIRVLLVTGGEPSFFDDSQRGEGPGASPFLLVQTFEFLPRALEAGSWQLCVLPCETYLSSGGLPPELPAIVYGPSSLALECLEAGASDFMRPGWSRLELEARLFRYWRPELRGDKAVYHLWARRLVRLGDLRAGMVSAVSEPGLELSSREASALRLLVCRSGRVLPFSVFSGTEKRSRAGTATDSHRAVSMMISRLRKKLLCLDPGLARCLCSARGQGYLWIEPRLR